MEEELNLFKLNKKIEEISNQINKNKNADIIKNIELNFKLLTNLSLPEINRLKDIICIAKDNLDFKEYYLMENENKYCEVDYTYQGENYIISNLNMEFNLIKGEVYTIGYNNLLGLGEHIRSYSRKDLIIKHNNYDMYPQMLKRKDVKNSIYYITDYVSDNILMLLEMKIFKKI